MRLLVIGSRGQVATALRELAPMRGFDVSVAGRPLLDLREPDTIRAAIHAADPAFIVNAAAYTSVDDAETDQATAYALNAAGARHVALLSSAAGIPLIHLSTDYVFDGAKGSPYAETDPTDPLNVYGSSKLAGENYVAAQHPEHVILRTSWIYGASGRNFVRTMLRLASSRPALNVVDDQYGAPTYALDIAAAIINIAHAIQHGRGKWGTFHACGSGTTTWYGLACCVFERSKQLHGPSADVQRVTTAQYPTSAKRPLDTRLDCSKLAANYGLVLPDWRDGLDRCLTKIASGGWRLT